MLKKKTQIPPRPRPPNPEQITEDLERAPENDIAFGLKVEESVVSEETDVDQKSVTQIWTEVEDFVQGNSRLQHLLEQLRSQSEHLQASELELRGMAEDIRQQAIDALK